LTGQREEGGINFVELLAALVGHKLFDVGWFEIL